MKSFTNFQQGFFNRVLCEDDSKYETDEKFSLFKQIIPLRVEQLPKLKKDMKEQLVAREFMKHVSVFRLWKKDSPNILKESFELDWA